MNRDAMNRRGGAGVGVLVVVVVAVLALAGALVWAVGSTPAGAEAEAAVPAGVDEARSIQASLEAAGVYLERDELGKAEAVLTSAVGEFAEDVPLRLSLAEVLLRQERIEEAYGQYEAALAIEPNAAAVQFQAGTIAAMLDRTERAAEHYSMARSMDATVAQYPLYLAAVQQELGLIGEAKENFLFALHLDRSDPTAAAALAQIALNENDRELALNYARTAREIEPGQAAYVVLEARALQRLARPEEAIGLLLALPDEALYQVGVLTLASECLGLLRRPGDAAGLWADAADADAGSAEKAFQAALWFERAGDAEKAKQYASRAGMLGHAQAAGVVERLENE
ncbi:MAG: tetratricopeptide repeat protein [Planctomycetota bacterium]